MVSSFICQQVETQLRRVIERLHSLLSLLQTTIPDVLNPFTEYFYMQIQQTLVWILAILLKSQNIPNPILYGNSKVTQLGEQSKQYHSILFFHSIDNQFFLMMLCYRNYQFFLFHIVVA